MNTSETDQKELAEYIIKKILDGEIFFIAEESLIETFENGGHSRFERTRKDIKLRGFKGLHNLYFTKKDDNFKIQTHSIVIGAGANFETLMGIIFENKIPAHCHVYYIGSRFDLDKLSEMVYSLFTELGENHIKETARSLVFYAEKKQH